mmetsp:Transcript_18933/g.26370  ORF Transcript_18933/g.26370 Transcript_18933/m.26370 type:complete len:103 (-) Transcript_18933:122-430(-)
MAEKKITMKELWPQIFKAFDTDNDGQISKKEINEALTKAGVCLTPIVKIIEISDTNNDSIVTKAEWDSMYPEMIKKSGEPPPQTIEFTKKMIANLNMKSENQ